ncbi:MAG TPA: hypothetical protein VFV38_05535 [Ktedonobacteraceae bacterium]|nr:hypothetical protein [Ktedonobacteraceae bacterium]
MATHAQTASKDIASVALIKYIVGLHNGVAARLHEYDSWPNIDGHIEILYEDRQPMGVIWAQVKGLPENHGLKFACPTGLFEFAAQIGPIFLLGVDLKEERIYWNYYDEDSVAGLEYASKQTLTVEFDPDRSFTKQEMDYIEAWKQLVIDRKARILGLRDTIRNQLLNMIDVSKKLLDNYRYTETIRYLTGLKDNQWDIADNSARFRILTNMAAALYQCNKPGEAAQYFLEAYKFDPGAPKALSNRAFAYLLKNEFKKAQAEASEILKTNPLDLQASAIKVLAMGELGRKYKTIKMSIDSNTLETAEVSYALGFVAQKARLTGEARSLFERAASQDDDPHMAATFGINLLEEITIDNPRATRSTLTVAQRDQARRAVDLLQKAWAYIPDEEDRKIRHEWLFNRMMAYRIVGEDYNAEKAADELLRLKSDEDLYAKYAAIIAFESGKLTTAEAYLTRQIGNGSQMPDLKLILVDVFMTQGKLDKAEGLALEFIGIYEKQDHLWIIAHQTLFALYLKQEHFDKASQLATQLTAQNGTKVLGQLFSARLAIMKQDSELAASLLEQAEAGMPEDIDKTAVLTLAEEAYTAKVYEIAAKAYEKVLQPDVDDQFTGRFLHSLFEAKRFQMAITVAESIRKKYGASRRVTQFEWSSYLELQDLPNARKVFVEYLKTHPEDEDAKLSIALIDVRSDNSGELDKFLDEPKDLGKLSLHSRIQLAELYELSGRTTQALELSYDTRKKFENAPDAHMAYFSLMARLDASVPELLEPATVQPNSVLLYNGGFFVIEADHEPQIRDNEISVEEARRRGFIDKKVRV